MQKIHRISANVVKELCSEINKLIREDKISESNYSGSEIRIFDFHSISKNAAMIWNYVNPIIKATYPNVKLKDCLAIVNKPLEEQNPRNTLGRWHKDSLSQQLKLFIYLSEVGSQDGPTEIIINSNSFFSNLKLFVFGSLIKPSEVFKSTRSYQSIPDQVIQSCFKSYSIKSVLSEPGDCYLIDTSNVHRAAPNKGKTRIALTYYLDL